MHLKWILSHNTAINQIKTRRREEKDKIITKIEEGRIQLGLDMIVKTSTGEVASEKNNANYDTLSNGKYYSIKLIRLEKTNKGHLI